MPVVPTQLLGYADGGMSQGFSSLYDFKILNANLLVAGEVVNLQTYSGGEFVNNARPAPYAALGNASYPVHNQVHS